MEPAEGLSEGQWLPNLLMNAQEALPMLAGESEAFCSFGACRKSKSTVLMASKQIFCIEDLGSKRGAGKELRMLRYVSMRGYLSACIYVYMYLSIYISLSIYPSIYLSVYPYVYMYIYIYI